MKTLSSICSNLKMNNQMSKYLTSVDGSHFGRIFVTSSYQHQIRTKSSSNSGDNHGRKGSFEQSIVENLSNHSYQMLDTDFPSISESSEEQKKNFAKEVANMRNVLKDLRKWEYTQFGRLVGESTDRCTIGDGTRFFVMNYNILSPQLLSSHLALYNGCDPRALDPSFRKQLLFAELDDIKPDILCLQEVEETDFYKVFEPTLLLKGYKGVYKKRTGDKSDGCAIFYKTSRFGFIDKLAVEYFQPNHSLLNRDNVGLFVKLRSHHYSTGRFQTFVVGTTHILFNPKRQDVKLAQVQLLLAEMDRFTFNGFDPNGHSTHVPVIMTGDFNADPYSPLTRFMADGVNRLSSVYGPSLDRSEGSQNAVTTKQFCWTTVDYIFYSKIWNKQHNKQTEGKLKLIRRLGLLTRQQCKELGPIPSLATSSDHFSLVAEFVLK